MKFRISIDKILSWIKIIQGIRIEFDYLLNFKRVEFDDKSNGLKIEKLMEFE